MGKKRFIDPKKDVVHTIVLSSKKLPGLGGALLACPEASKKVKPSKALPFQLRCDISAEENAESPACDVLASSDVASPGSMRFSDDFPALGEKSLGAKHSVKSKNTPEEEGHDNSLGSMEMSCSSAWQTNAAATSEPDADHDGYDKRNEPYKFSSYGIYFDDDYDYEQHLRDPNDWPLADAETEMYSLPKEHPQAHKKNGAKKLGPISEVFSYEAPPYDATTSKSQSSVRAPDEPYDELFDDAEEGDLPDDIMHFLDGDDGSYDCDEEDALDSDGYMDVSDDDGDEEEEEEEHNTSRSSAQLPPACAAGAALEARDADATPQDQATGSHLDSFFERIPGVEEAEELPRPAVAAPLQSSRGARPVTAEYERFNEKFDALLLRDYQDAEVGDARLEEVEGYLGEDAASQLTQGLRPVRYRDERVALVGPAKEQETTEDSQVRLQALQYCKAYREARDKPFEVCVPDPSAMKYNVTNVPTVRNKNMPIVVKNELPFLSRRKEGLSVKDLKQHDAELNTPHREIDEEAQTYKTMLSELSYRPPGENSEQRRQRKAAVKELKRARREEKKLNSQAHKDMILRTTRVNMNAKHSKGIPLL